MGQKVHPLALRLQSSTRQSDHLWFSDFYYSQLVSQDLGILSYLATLMQCVRLPQSRVVINHMPHTTVVYTLICYPKTSREYKSKLFHLPQILPRGGRKKTYFGGTPPYIFQPYEIVPLWMKLFLTDLLVQKQNTSGNSLFKGNAFLHISKIPWKTPSQKIDFVTHILENSRKTFQACVSKAHGQGVNHFMEVGLCSGLGTPVTVIPFRIHFEWQDAGFFADELVLLLQRGISFRQIKSRLFRGFQTNPYISGLRITCSGRVGGKSKKAQRAKIESLRYGQTSFHVFSSRVDFACRTALTSLGAMGVKVWICYTDRKSL